MKIFLDLDGVVADFDRHAFECFGIECADMNISTADMTPAQREREDRLYRLMYEHEDFFGSIPLMKDAMLLVDHVRRIDPEFRILTAAPAPRDFAHDIFERSKRSKIAWSLARLDLPQERIIVCRSRDKHLQVAEPAHLHVLIDDRPRNIDRWIDAGGTGILHRAVESSIEALASHHVRFHAA